MNSVHVVGGYWTKVRCISIAIEWSRQVGEIAVVCCTQLQCGACLPYFIGMSQGEHSDLRVLAPVGAEWAQSSLGTWVGVHMDAHLLKCWEGCGLSQQGRLLKKSSLEGRALRCLAQEMRGVDGLKGGFRKNLYL
jgi:hypothetical protein